MKKGYVYIQLREDSKGNLKPVGFKDVLGEYTNEQLKSISKMVDGYNVIPCPVVKRDEHGYVTEFGVPIPE